MVNDMVSGRLKFLILIYVLAAVWLGGCSDSSEEVQEPRMVVEGQIDSDGYPRVFLTLSATADASGGIISENIIRWGVVKLSDGENEVILTGGPMAGVLPPYIYYSYDMVGVPGRSYTLTAEYKDKKVTSEVTMPEPTEIEGVRISGNAADDRSRDLTIMFNSPADAPAYYHLSVRVSGSDNRFYPCNPGTIAVMEGGKRVEMPVYKGNGGLSSGNDREGFTVGERVTVRLARVAPEVYDFWRAWDNAALTGGSVFVGSSVSLPSNISGGYGVWSAQGVSDLDVEIQ